VIRRAILTAACFGSISLRAGWAQGSPVNPPPPLPWIETEACPGEVCDFGEWAACTRVTVRTEKRPDAPVAFTLKPGERFTAVTGEVRVDRPGLVVFRDTLTYVPQDWEATQDTIHVGPRDTLYVLNYIGEGYGVWWLHARADTGLLDWWAGPKSRAVAPGVLVRKAQEVWWVQVRNRAGKEGWVMPSYRTMSGAAAHYDNGVDRCGS
jgi:hypothetical protein